METLVDIQHRKIPKILKLTMRTLWSTLTLIFALYAFLSLDVALMLASLLVAILTVLWYVVLDGQRVEDQDWFSKREDYLDSK